MSDKVLIDIEDRVIKGIVLKVLRQKNLEFMEEMGIKDLQLKLEIFQDTILFHIIQISKSSYKEQFEFIKSMKREGLSGFPVLAIIPAATAEFVGGAKNVGIEDVVLIPEKKELFRDLFTARLTEFIKKVPSKKPVSEVHSHGSTVTELASDKDLNHELKRAARGKYSVSFVMGRFTGVNLGQIQEFYEGLKKELRDTDKIVQYNFNTFVVVCPFTIKSYLTEVEKKIRDTFEGLFGGYSRTQRLDMYGVTYPDNGRNIEELVEIMEKGVHDSIIISNIREPLNSISRDRLEDFRRMLKLYK